MCSYSRNSRKPTQAVQLAFAAALLAGSAAHAADSRYKFELTAFSNTTAGSSLVQGHYETALAQLGAAARTSERDTLNTNRCVAYTAMHELEAARKACNDAVLEAQTNLTHLPVSMSWSRSDYRDYLAVAYSNRAVLNWLLNDGAAAKEDLKKAASVSPRAEFVARNLTALQSHAAVAQVTVLPKS